MSKARSSAKKIAFARARRRSERRNARCVGGRGYYREWGKDPVELTPGATVSIPANVKHWHGAASDSWFSHLALEIPSKDTSTEWCEPVTDEEYDKLRG